MHLVHYNTRYGSFEEASQRSDGLMVLTLLFQVNDQSNPDLGGLIKIIQGLHNKSEKSISQSLNLARIIPKETHEFFRYQGSLTTPECNESALFLIFANPQQIGSEQVCINHN